MTKLADPLRAALILLASVSAQLSTIAPTAPNTAPNSSTAAPFDISTATPMNISTAAPSFDATACPANPSVENAAKCAEIKAYIQCVTWAIVCFFIVGLALATVGFRLYKVALAAIGFVLSYFLIYPALAEHTDLSVTVCWVIMVVCGLALAVVFYFLSDTVGIFAMGFFLGALFASTLLMFLAYWPEAKTWIDAHNVWFPKLCMAVLGLAYGIVSLKSKDSTIVSSTSFAGSFLIGDAVDFLCGNGQVHIVFKSYASSFGSDYPKEGFCPLTNYVMIGILILWGISSAVQSYFQKIHLKREKIAQEYKAKQKVQKQQEEQKGQQDLEMAGPPIVGRRRTSTQGSDDDGTSDIPGAH